MSEENAIADNENAEAKPVTKKKAVGISKEAKLTVLATENPKRSGSGAYDRFEGYLCDPAPATVQEALDAGLTMGDIGYDLIHGSIEVEGATVEEYTPTKRGPRKETEEASDEEVSVDSGDSEASEAGDDDEMF